MTLKQGGGRRLSKHRRLQSGSGAVVSCPGDSFQDFRAEVWEKEGCVRVLMLC